MTRFKGFTSSARFVVYIAKLYVPCRRATKQCNCILRSIAANNRGRVRLLQSYLISTIY